MNLEFSWWHLALRQMVYSNHWMITTITTPHFWQLKKWKAVLKPCWWKYLQVRISRTSTGYLIAPTSLGELLVVHVGFVNPLPHCWQQQLERRSELVTFDHGKLNIVGGTTGEIPWEMPWPARLQRNIPRCWKVIHGCLWITSHVSSFWDRLPN